MAIGFQNTVGTGDILSEAIALARRNVGLFALCAFVMVLELNAIEFGLRQWARDLVTAHRWAVWAKILPTMISNYIMIVFIINTRNATRIEFRTASLMYFIITSFIASIGILGGMVLLIIPGIILALRWNIALNFVIAKEFGPIESMKASWAATRDSAGAIFGAVVLVGLLQVLGTFAISGGIAGARLPMLPAQVIILNLYVGILSVVGLYVTTATYALLVGWGNNQLTDVFT